MSEVFYVYEHTRNDTNQIFYVGKGMEGSGRSDSIFSRNKHWRNIVNKAGFTARKKIVEIIDEELSFLIEIERISQLREMGVKLCNMTDGGEGMSGYVPSSETREKLSKALKGRKHSEETLKKIVKASRSRSQEVFKKISVSLKGYKHSEETKEKHRAMHQAFPRIGKQNFFYGKKHSAEAKKKMSLAKKNISAETRAKISEANKNPSAETRAKLSKAQKGKKHSIEACRKISIATSGENNHNFGKTGEKSHNYGKTHSKETRAKISEANTNPSLETRAKLRASALKRPEVTKETRAKMRTSQLALPKITCPNCYKEGKASIMHRWHFDNCKKRVVIN